MPHEISQAIKDKYNIICGILKTKEKQNHRYREQVDSCQKRGGGETEVK